MVFTMLNELQVEDVMKEVEAVNQGAVTGTPDQTTDQALDQAQAPTADPTAAPAPDQATNPNEPIAQPPVATQPAPVQGAMTTEPFVPLALRGMNLHSKKYFPLYDIFYSSALLIAPLKCSDVSFTHICLLDDQQLNCSSLGNIFLYQPKTWVISRQKFQLAARKMSKASRPSSAGPPKTERV